MQGGEGGHSEEHPEEHQGHHQSEEGESHGLEVVHGGEEGALLIMQDGEEGTHHSEEAGHHSEEHHAGEEGQVLGVASEENAIEFLHQYAEESTEELRLQLVGGEEDHFSINDDFAFEEGHHATGEEAFEMSV